ncbi:MAG: SURF1 family protein [Pararhodobacter sp.]
MGRFIGAAIFGIGGVAILLSLGFWQLSRLDWKLALIAEIEARISQPEAEVPADANAGRDRFLPVRAVGRFTGERVNVLSSMREAGPGARIIAVLETLDGRRLLVDRGFVAQDEAQDFVPEAAQAEVRGNLDWPTDSDAFTPAPDLARNLWFSRSVEPIAAYLGTEPVMIVARQDSAAQPPLITTPISGATLRNDHLEYAITWFLLAAVWAVMTTALLWRIRPNRA